MKEKKSSLLSAWIFIGAIVVTLVLLVILGTILWLFHAPQEAQVAPTAELVVISAPTSIHTPAATSPVPAATQTSEAVVVEGISRGTYVQIFDTGTAGLRLRSGPGVNEPTQFLAPEGEVYLVSDGPRDGDDYTWWYLIAPYDQSRSGWAVSKYLKPVSATSN